MQRDLKGEIILHRHIQPQRFLLRIVFQRDFYDIVQDADLGHLIIFTVLIDHVAVNDLYIVRKGMHVIARTACDRFLLHRRPLRIFHRQVGIDLSGKFLR